MAMNEERFARLNEDMARLAQVSDQLAQIVMEMRQVVVLSERRLTLAEERMARHEERMAEIDREAAQTRNMFIRACERLGAVRRRLGPVTPILAFLHQGGGDFGWPRRRNLEG